MNSQIAEIRQVLQNFQDGYTARDISKLDEFMKLFLPGGEVELIGIGASARNQVVQMEMSHAKQFAV